MPRTPGLLLSPSPTKQGLKSSLLFHWRARDLSLIPLTGQTPTFSRGSAGGAVLDRYGRYSIPVHSQPRYEMVDLDGDGIRETAGLVLGPARTNLALWSSDFGNAVWTGAGGFTVTDAVSVLPGQVAKRHTNLNAGTLQNRLQSVGVLSAAGDTVFAIVENVDADTTDIALQDGDLGSSVVRGTFTWATRSLVVTSGAGSVFAVKLAEAGPNGGPTYLLGVSGVGTTGNIRRITIYPTGVLQNGKIAILHHGQLEGGVLFPTSPIITGAASAARSQDGLSWAFPHRVDSLSVYLRYVSRGHEHNDTTSRALVGLGNTSVSQTRLFMLQGTSGTGYSAQLGGVGAGASGSAPNAAVDIGEEVELLMTLAVAANRTAVARMTLAHAGVMTVSTPSAVTAVAETWQDNVLSMGNSFSMTAEDLKVAPGILTLDQAREAF